MQIRCQTNLDNYKREHWPEKFCCRPVIGDAVHSSSGKKLYIVCITHTMYDPMEYRTTLGQTDLIPMLLI